MLRAPGWVITQRRVWDSRPQVTCGPDCAADFRPETQIGNPVPVREGSSLTKSAGGLSLATKAILALKKHKDQGVRLYLRDCRECAKDEKDKLFNELRRTKAEGVRRTANKEKVEIDEPRALFSLPPLAKNGEPPVAPTTLRTRTSLNGARLRS